MSLAWPLLRYAWGPESGSRRLGLPWPLLWWHKQPQRDRTYFHLLPFLHRRRGKRALTSLLPFFWWWRDGDFRGSAWLWYLEPPEDQEVVRRHVVLWKLLTYHRERDGDFDFRILHKLIRTRREGDYSELLLTPMVRSETDRDLYRFSVLGSVCQYENDAGKRALRLLHFIRIPL